MRNLLVSSASVLTAASSLVNAIDITGSKYEKGWYWPVQAETPEIAPLGPNLPSAAPVDGSTYDYVIVGSGAGGAPLAARLALADYSVLLIEAGEDHGNDVPLRVPAFHPMSTGYVPIQWDFFVNHYENETQAKRDSKYVYAVNGGDDEFYVGQHPPEGAEPLGIYYPRVNALGGCTQHNALIAVKPQDGDWDYVAELMGDDSWSSANMGKYWQRIEKCQYLEALLSPAGHGTDGWLNVAMTPAVLIAEDLKILSLILGAASAMGKTLLSSLVYTVTGLAEILALDINTASSSRDTTNEIYQIPLAASWPDYKRSSPRDFVVEVANATNADGSKKYKLDIVMNTLATKVNFDTSGTTPRATGVDYLHGKSLYRADPRASKTEDGGVPGTVHARKEVIVSGGTFNTPQLLKLSGVGPADELSNFGIDVVVDAPGVGGNMMDRYEVAIIGEADSKFDLLKECTFLNGTEDPCYEKWSNPANIDGLKGGYTTNGISYGYMNHSSVDKFVGPDIYMGGIPTYFVGYFPGYSTQAVDNLDSWAFYVLKGHSHNNAGTVNLTSANPRDVPLINFHSLMEGVGGEEDVQAIWEGLQYQLRALDNTPALGGAFHRSWPPVDTVSSEEEFKQFIKDEAWGHHASCTVPMGARDDPLAVLDSDFKVRGVSGLRVVDASIFPRIPGFFISSSIYMASEKAADVIIAEDKSA